VRIAMPRGSPPAILLGADRFWAHAAALALLLAAVVVADVAVEEGKVSCGFARKESCEVCGSWGRAWCSGDCRWRHDKCVTEAESFRGEEGEVDSRGFPFPPDTRSQKCKEVTDDFSNHTVSIIIPWLAETWEHMEATLKALVYFTPTNLIEEIIFVSDGNADSREAALKAISDKVVVIALPTRHGLIRAKMKAVSIAKAPVLLFMESHCIVNRNWLPPLLQRVRENPRVLAMPQLDFIPATDFRVYYPATVGHWRYEWNMNLVFTNPGDFIKDDEVPYVSPGTSGGIFAMRKDWFQHLGLFDPYMLEWGGDHFELTMKVWRCGGAIEIVPCSRMGHLFREVVHRPYHVSEWQVVHNYARLAQVWIPDHLRIFYKVKPQAFVMWLGDLSEQLAKRDELKCKSMEWYLDNVDQELKWEADKTCLWTPNPAHYLMWCENKPPDGRSIVAKEMPPMEYLAAKQAARARAEQLREISEWQPGSEEHYDGIENSALPGPLYIKLLWILLLASAAGVGRTFWKRSRPSVDRCTKKTHDV